MAARRAGAGPGLPAPLGGRAALPLVQDLAEGLVRRCGGLPGGKTGLSKPFLMGKRCKRSWSLRRAGGDSTVLSYFRAVAKVAKD